VGKTRAAIEVAKHFQTEIISADSRQCYKELKIGVARPSEEELASVRHHFIASHSINDNITAAYFEDYALEIAGKIFKKNDRVVLVGGTGLYIKAFCEGLDPVPAIDPSLREKIIADYELGGLAWLRDEIEKKDPRFYQKGEMQNPQRMMRALEVVESTGKSILDFHNKEKKQRAFDTIMIGLELPKNELARNIDHRVNEMLRQGLVEEVKALIPSRDFNALQTVGYKELFDFFDGSTSMEKAIEAIKTNTRQYAKRQMTWFKKQNGMNWLHPEMHNAMIRLAGGSTVE
jgi:tRNA dimethylallyltransferase